MEGQPLLGVLRGLILDGEEQADFAADPSGYMARAGYDDMSADEVTEAVGLVADTLPPHVAQAVTTATEPGDGEDADAFGMLEQIATIDADGIPPLEVPPEVEPAHGGNDDYGSWAEDDTTSFGEATDAFGDVTDSFDDEGAAADIDGGEAPGSDGGAGDPGPHAGPDGPDTGHGADAHSAGTGVEGDAYGDADLDDMGRLDPFAREAAEPSPAEVGGQVPLADAHDVDDDPVDFDVGLDVDFGGGSVPPEGPAPSPGEGGMPPAPEGTEPSDHDAFGTDADLGDDLGDDNGLGDGFDDQGGMEATFDDEPEDAFAHDDQAYDGPDDHGPDGHGFADDGPGDDVGLL